MLNIWAAQLNPTVGAPKHNANLVFDAWQQAKKAGAHLVVTPELALSGYPPEDLLLGPGFLAACKDELLHLASRTKDGPPLLVGTPWQAEGHLFNAAVMLQDGRVHTIACKSELPNYGVFDEKRYFTAAPGVSVTMVSGVRVGIAICEDLWLPTTARALKDMGAELIVAPNASPYEARKGHKRFDVVRYRVEETGLPILYLNLWGGQDELVFDGRSFTFNPGDSAPTNLQAPFTDAQFMVTVQKTNMGLRFADSGNAPQPEHVPDMYKALCCGLFDYVQKNNFKSVVLGLSGGIDSALTAAIAADCLGADRVTGVLMPSPWSSDHSVKDAEDLAQNLGIKTHTVAIEPAMEAFEAMLAPAFAGKQADVTEENLQARIRGVVLMAFSNKFNHLLLTTGNKSELSVGYATLYGDMNGGFNPLKDVYKTTVFAMAKWRAAQGPSIPENTISKPPSAELKPGQKDSDSLPDYDTLDIILRNLVEEHRNTAELMADGFDKAMVTRVAGLLRRAEYKRRQAAPGVKISRVAFGRDFRFPITNHYVD